MNRALDKFVLVGARISKLSVDESATRRTLNQFELSINKIAASVSPHRYGERVVIEIRVALTASHSDPEATSANQETNRPVLEAELAAGFVGLETSHDGDLDAFKQSKEDFYRFAYWMLRERLASVFSVTVLRGAHVPWDLAGLEESTSPIDSSKTSKLRAKRATQGTDTARPALIRKPAEVPKAGSRPKRSK